MKIITVNNTFSFIVLSYSLFQLILKTFHFKGRKLSLTLRCLITMSPIFKKKKQKPLDWTYLSFSPINPPMLSPSPFIFSSFKVE